MGTLSDVVAIMNQATRYAAYAASQLEGVIPDPKYGNLDSSTAAELFDEFNLDIGHQRLKTKLRVPNEARTEDTVEVDGERMYLQTCMAIYGNGGHTRGGVPAPRGQTH